MAQRPPVRPKEPEPAKAKGGGEAAKDSRQAPHAAPPASPAKSVDVAADKAQGAADAAHDKGNAAGKDAKDNEAREREAKEKEVRDRERRQLRTQNLTPKRPDAAFLKTLSSDIKRNTAFIRKLKLGGYFGTAGEALIAEFTGLNLSRYVSEAVANIADAPLKTADVPVAVRLISAIHQRYAEFSSALVPALVKHFAPVKGPEPEADKAARLARKRVTGRLLVELYEAGLYTGAWRCALTRARTHIHSHTHAHAHARTRKITSANTRVSTHSATHCTSP